MATSSIKTNFVIEGKKEILNFADAIEASISDKKQSFSSGAKKVSSYAEFKKIRKKD